MLAVEIALIAVGVAFLVVSHFVQERFSDKDIQEIAKMSEAQLDVIVEKQVKATKGQVENSVEDIIDESLAITKRGLERVTNEKIMAINEYSDTVMESMNKTHNEIMFLYSMLNDKQAELTDMVGALQKYSKSAKKEKEIEKEEPLPIIEEAGIAEASTLRAARESQQRARVMASDAVLEGKQESLFFNKNVEILSLYKEGKTEVEIAKSLDCGLGEVRLVLGLFKEESSKL